MHLDSSVKLVDDPILGYKMLPGGDIDNNGFRNKQILKNYDIVAIGDSQTFGNQAYSEESWPVQLGYLSGLKVYNMAVGGYGPLQYAYLLDQALNFNPKIIIFGIYLGNDLFDAYTFTYNRGESGYWNGYKNPDLEKKISVLEQESPILDEGLTPIHKNSEAGKKLLGLRNFLRTHLTVYKLISQKSWIAREKLGMVKSSANLRIQGDKKWATENPELGTVYEDKTIGTVLTPAYRLRALNLDDIRIKEGYRITLKALGDSCNKISSSGRKCLLIIIPTKEAVYAEKVRKNPGLSRTYGNLIYYEELIRKSLLDFCNREEIDCLDMLPYLREALNGGVAIYPPYSDGHPRKEGYKKIAESILNYLKENNLL